MKKLSLLFIAFCFTAFAKAQNVGIGTTAPTARLHVNGNIAFSPDSNRLISVNNNSMPGFAPGASLTVRAASSFPGGATASRGGSLVLQAGNGLNFDGLPNSGGDVFLRSGGNIDAADNGFFNGGNIIFQTGNGFNINNDNWTEQMRINYQGNVGIGNATPHAALQFGNVLANRRIVLWEDADNDHQYNGFGISPAALRYQVTNSATNHVFYAGSSTTTSTELMRIQGNGNVGIGTATPNAPLQFKNIVTNRGIVLFTDVNNDHQFYGLGINAFTFRYQVNETSASHVFFAGSSATTSNELMRIQGNGNVGIGNLNPQFRLDVSGAARLTGGYTILNSSQDNSQGNISVGDPTGIANAKLYVRSNQFYGAIIENTAAGAIALRVVGNASVTGTLSKGGGSFKIDHPLDPENKYLYHSFVESPDMMNVYNGNTTTNTSGEAVVEMPDWFEALNRDFRYQLTVMGQFAQAIVGQEIKGNQFVIKTDKPNVKVSWQVTGIRHDAFANKNRIPVEETKKTVEKGKYLHPESFGLSAEMGVDKALLKMEH